MHIENDHTYNIYLKKLFLINILRVFVNQHVPSCTRCYKKNIYKSYRNKINNREARVTPISTFYHVN